ncbi:MAG: hypothetical protein GY754_36425 [bacterium]|nr:hypothetical protein [bacterium]
MFLKKKIPQWAPFKKYSQYKEFIGLVESIQTKRGYETTRRIIETGEIYLERAHYSGERWKLSGIARECASLREQNWEERITRRIEEFVNKKPANKKNNEVKKNPALQTLRLQAMSRDYISKINISIEDLVHYNITDSIYGILVQDSGQGEAEKTITYDELKLLNISSEEAFKEGQKNAVQAEANMVELFEIDSPGGKIFTTSSNGFYLIANLLEMLKKMDSPSGILISMPTWHHAFMLELAAGQKINPFILQIHDLSEKMYNKNTVAYEGLDTTVYWYRNNEGFIPIPIVSANGNLLPAVPEELRNII